MSNLSTFGTFTMARLGIYVSQQALNVTGNNISNINTEGYTRQQLEQKAMSFGGADRYITRFAVRENGGVLATGVNQLRDKYLDIRYRNEMTKVGEMKAKLKGLDDLADIFDEVAKGEEGEGVLEARFNDLIQQLENLSQPQNVGQDVSDSLVQKAATAIAKQFRDYAEQLSVLRENTVLEFKDNITSVNMTLDKIRDLNESIRKADIFGSDALAQRDQRNLLIDELSEKIGINVTYEMEKIDGGIEIEKLKITTESGRALVDGVYTAQLKLLNENNFDLGISELKNAKGKADPDTPNALNGTAIDSFNVVDQSGARKFTSREEAETAWELLNNDPAYYENPSDSSKAYYYHLVPETEGAAGTEYVIHQHDTGMADTAAGRGPGSSGYVVTPFRYVDATTAPVTKLDDTELSGALQAQRELLTEAGEYTDDNTIQNVDKEAGTKRGIPYYQEALDNLARTFAEKMNEANTLSDDVIYQKDEDGEFVLDNGKKVLKDEYKYYNGGALFSNNGNTDDTADITAANISVAYGWSHGATHVLRTKQPLTLEQSTKQDNIDHFITLLTSDQDFEYGAHNIGRTKFTGTFQDMLTDSIAGTLAKDQSITQSMLNNYNASADELYLDRDSIMGVDLNDEAMNMMMFQKAYSAACRLMTTYDGMLDKLINGTAV